MTLYLVHWFILHDIKISNNIQSTLKILHIGLFNKNNKTKGLFELSVSKRLQNTSGNFIELFKATLNKPDWKYDFLDNTEDNMNNFIVYPEFEYRFQLNFKSNN